MSFGMRLPLAAFAERLRPPPLSAAVAGALPRVAFAPAGFLARHLPASALAKRAEPPG